MKGITLSVLQHSNGSIITRYGPSPYGTVVSFIPSGNARRWIAVNPLGFPLSDAELVHLRTALNSNCRYLVEGSNTIPNSCILDAIQNIRVFNSNQWETLLTYIEKRVAVNNRLTCIVHHYKYVPQFKCITLMLTTFK